MARAMVTCTCEECGEEFEVVTFKPSRAEARNFEEWAKYNITLCRECRQKIDREEERKRSAPADERIGNIGLTGSVKQIAWATDIRRSLVYKTMEELSEMKEEAGNEKNQQKISSCEDYLSWVIKNKTEARFWIDAREQSSLIHAPAVLKEWSAAKRGNQQECNGTKACAFGVV